MLAEFPDFSMIEAKAYLELADWKLKDAIRSAKDDHEWEMEQNEDNEADRFNMREFDCNNNNNTKDIGSRITTGSSSVLKSGQIRIIPKLNRIGEAIGFHTKGAGIIHQPLEPSAPSSQQHNKDSIEEQDNVTTTNVSTRYGSNTTTIETAQTMKPIGNQTTDDFITTKTTAIVPLSPPDIYAQHNNFGVELQSFSTN